MFKNKSILLNVKILLYFSIVFISIFTILNSYSFFIMTNYQKKIINKTLPTIYKMNRLKNHIGDIEKYFRESVLTNQAFVLEKNQKNLEKSILKTKKLLKSKGNNEFSSFYNQVVEIQNVINKFIILKKNNIKLQRKRDNYIENLNTLQNNIKKQSNINKYNTLLLLLTSAINEKNFRKVEKLRKEFLTIQKVQNIQFKNLDFAQVNYKDLFDNQIEIIKKEYRLKKIISHFVHLESLSLQIKKINDELISKEQNNAEKFENKFYKLSTYSTIMLIISLMIFILFISYIQKISKRMLLLKDNMSQYVNGNKVNIEMNINDEIGIIAKNFMHFVNKVSFRENELENEKQKAQDTTKSKSLFLANMSHEIRTPINGIIGMTHLVLQTKLDKKQKDYLEKVNQSSHILLDIINDILDISKIEAGKLSIENINFSMNEIIEYVKNSMELKVKEKNLEFNIYYNEKDQIFYGDSLRISQILINLLSNAIKFTNIGKVELVIEYTKNDIIKFYVKDTGIGISKTQQKKLFQSFSQADGEITRKYGGSGLGLAISKELIELMNGKIWVNSELNIGSEFIFEIKLPFGNNSKVKHFNTSENLDVLRTQMTTLKGSHILLAEDNKINQEIIINLLHRSEIIIDLAKNGEEAVNMYRANKDKYELILMDLQMPIMDGITASKIIKEDNTSIPIIALTANAMKDDLDKTHAIGMIEHITKPINVEKLYKTLLQYIPKKYTEKNISNFENTKDTSNFGFKYIDEKIGLSFMADNKELYTKILKDFYAEYINLQDKKLSDEEFKIEIHTLKGLAGNIGATDLYDIVNKLNKKLEPTLLIKFYEELKKVLDELKYLNVKDEHNIHKSTLTIDKKTELFCSLKIAIKTNRPQNCIPIINDIEKYLLSSEDEKLFTQIKQSIDMYDFKKALELL